MTKTHAYLIAILALIAALAAWYFARPIAHAPQRAALSEQGVHWAERIQKAGGKASYDEFARAVKTLPPELQHEGAHVFGEALFSTMGVSGLTVCDARFSYGCYHEFLGRAIAALGLGVVNELNEGCAVSLGSNALSCQHGIGHGIQAALGYDEKALREALAMCKDLPHNDPIGGCYGGVFMEYNMQTMLGEDGRTRPIRGDDPLFPCNALESPYLRACYFWSPQWWINLQHQALGLAHLDVPAVGALCDRSGSEELARACYEGLGTVIPPESDFDAALTARMCESASQDALHQLYCKSYAANSLTVGGSGKTGDGLAVCDGLTGAFASYCAAYATNQANLAQQLPDVAE